MPGGTPPLTLASSVLLAALQSCWENNGTAICLQHPREKRKVVIEVTVSVILNVCKCGMRIILGESWTELMKTTSDWCLPVAS